MIFVTKILWCRRSTLKVSQVGVFSLTCDTFFVLWPICVAGRPKNGDLRRFVSGPATLLSKKL